MHCRKDVIKTAFHIYPVLNGVLNACVKECEIGSFTACQSFYVHCYRVPISISVLYHSTHSFDHNVYSVGKSQSFNFVFKTRYIVDVPNVVVGQLLVEPLRWERGREGGEREEGEGERKGKGGEREVRKGE